jgi:hypothetical protein
MKKLPLVLLLFVLLAFVAGLAQLFRLRFEAGDIYPEYSSLRADPLGAKALYESLDKLVAARRNYQPLSKVDDGRQSTLFYLGVEHGDLRFTPEEWRDFESFAASGGRLVISLLPSYQKPAPARFQRRVTSTNAPPSSGSNPKKTQRPKPGKIPNNDEEFAKLRPVSIEERWRVEFRYADLPRDERGTYKPTPAFRGDVPDIPESIACHTALFFDNLDKSWQVIYARKSNRPVLIERRYKSGSIVLAADSYCFSNEALLKERQPRLLAWFIGPNQRVVFDETHLGVEESPGIAALGRKYRLHGLFAGLLLLAGLFVWKNSVSFVPPYEDDARPKDSGLIAGKESAAGFVNLLRRNLSSSELLGACITEWKKSCVHQVSKAKLERIQAVIDTENSLSPKERDPIKTYQTISGILLERNLRRET